MSAMDTEPNPHATVIRDMLMLPCCMASCSTAKRYLTPKRAHTAPYIAALRTLRGAA
jgi:hypothetical protein